MKKVLGICNLHDTPSLGQLTKNRPLGALSFLSRYGLMDFTLSNFSNSEIDRVVILTENNSSAVTNHTLQGNVWINNTRTGFLRVCLNEKMIESPKFNTDIANIEAHYSIIRETNPEYIIVAPTFFLMSFDFRKMLEFHEENGAEITCLYTTINRGKKEYLNCDSLTVENNHVVSHSRANVGDENKQNISLETFIFNREAFDKVMEMSHKVSAMYGFRKTINYVINHHRIPVYAYKYDGYVVPILSSQDYMNASFNLLSYMERQKLFHDDWPIYTTTHNTPPAQYGPQAEVRNSFIANGSRIKGTVINSVISRDVIVEEGAVVKNCILFSGTKVGKNSKLEFVVADKNVKIKEVKEVVGEEEHYTYISFGANI